MMQPVLHCKPRRWSGLLVLLALLGACDAVVEERDVTGRYAATEFVVDAVYGDSVATFDVLAAGGALELELAGGPQRLMQGRLVLPADLVLSEIEEAFSGSYAFVGDRLMLRFDFDEPSPIVPSQLSVERDVLRSGTRSGFSLPFARDGQTVRVENPHITLRRQ